jgi:hypothetical protein
MFLVGVSQVVAKIITTLVFQRLGIWYMCVRGGGRGGEVIVDTSKSPKM